MSVKVEDLIELFEQEKSKVEDLKHLQISPLVSIKFNEKIYVVYHLKTAVYMNVFRGKAQREQMIANWHQMQEEHEASVTFGGTKEPTKPKRTTKKKTPPENPPQDVIDQVNAEG